MIEAIVGLPGSGKTLWAVEPKNLQVFKSSASGNMLPAALSFATGRSGAARLGSAPSR